MQMRMNSCGRDIFIWLLQSWHFWVSEGDVSMTLAWWGSRSGDRILNRISAYFSLVELSNARNTNHL